MPGDQDRMNIRKNIQLLFIALIFQSIPFPAPAEDFTNAIHAYLQQRVEVEQIHIGIVVGLVDEQGDCIVSCGKLDNGTDREVNGDTVFEIGSITKTFTALLLQDLIERGEMKLDDPVAKHLPASVRMPTRNGREITLVQLATHSSGFPRMPDNFDPKRADNPYADYSLDQLHAFLSNCQLARDPGVEWEYSNLGMGLLGHVITLKAGTNYESLVVDRICRPLQMDSTRITLTPELTARFAQGHNALGYAVPGWDIQTLTGAGALRSTANDLLKYLSAHLGLTPSSLAPLMEKTHVVHYHRTNWSEMGLAWFVSRDPPETQIISHGGGTGGFSTYAGFNRARRRGVVILTNSRGIVDIANLGDFLLQSEWSSDRRPTVTTFNARFLDSVAGQYQRAPDLAPGVLQVRRIFLHAPKAVIYVPAAFGLALLLFLLWRAPGARRRWIILGGAVLAGGVLAALDAHVSKRVAKARSQPGIGIRHEGDRLFAQATGSSSWPVNVLLPPGTGELLSQSETRFFERLSGEPVTFSRDARGKVTGLTVDHQGKAFAYEKISDQPPKAPEPLKPRVAIRLDPKLLDACVGQYEFAPDKVIPEGAKVTIWREGDQLIWRARGKNATQGDIDLFPESETNFFLKIDGAQLTFLKNGQGEVTAVIHHLAGIPDHEGKKVKKE
jgi:serine-type D-Ala-D-Ala carboxypeptidase/endopeptidase